jgi:hypothetical protein
LIRLDFELVTRPVATESCTAVHMMAVNGVALAKPVITGNPLFDEWHINCTIHLVLIGIPIKILRDIILVVLQALP